MGFFTPGATFAASDAVLLVFGLGIFSSDAVAAGAASLPDPAGDAIYPWLWWGSMILSAGIGTAADASQNTQSERVTMITKAMRKTNQKQALVWVVQYVDSSGTPDILLEVANTRVLVALP